MLGIGLTTHCGIRKLNRGPALSETVLGVVVVNVRSDTLLEVNSVSLQSIFWVTLSWLLPWGNCIPRGFKLYGCLQFLEFVTFHSLSQSFGGSLVIRWNFLYHSPMKYFGVSWALGHTLATPHSFEELSSKGYFSLSDLSRTTGNLAVHDRVMGDLLLTVFTSG